MAEFVVSGVTYSSAKMDAMTQMHIVRRLTPILNGLRASMFDGDLDPLKAAMPIVEQIGTMDDAQIEYIVAACMRLVRMKQPQDKGWTPVWSESAKCPLFDTIGAFELLAISANVIRSELSSFFDGLDRNFNPGSQPSPQSS